MFICIYVYIYFFPDFSLCIRSISSQADSEDFVKSMKSFLENHPKIKSLHLESKLLESGKIVHEIISVNPLPIGLSELRKRLGGPLCPPLIFFTFKATIGVWYILLVQFFMENQMVITIWLYNNLMETQSIILINNMV